MNETIWSDIIDCSGVGTASAFIADQVKISENQVGVLEIQMQTVEVKYRRVWPRRKMIFMISKKSKTDILVLIVLPHTRGNPND